MIVLDTSAVLAIIWDEPEAEDFMRAVSVANSVLISASTRLELHAVCLHRRGDVEIVERFLSELDVITEAFDEEQLAIAKDAYDRYRQGRHGLNFGDCFAYALARARDLPLLFKGEDFAATDVKRAL